MKYINKGFMMNFKETVECIFGSATKFFITMVLLALVVVVSVWATGTTTARSFEKIVDTKIDERVDMRINDKVLTKLDLIQSDISFLVESSYSDYIVKVNKQVEKIKKDPSDIKMVDIEDIMQKWKTFPEARKTDDLVLRYTVIKDWYSRNQ